MKKNKEKRMQLEKEKQTNLDVRNQSVQLKAPESQSLKETGTKSKPQEILEQHFKSKVIYILLLFYFFF